MRSRSWVFAIILALTHGLLLGESVRDLRPFLEKHCYECHGAEEQKGDYRFDTLDNDLSNVETLEIWQHILDQVNLGEMPPRKQPQPTVAEAEALTDTLTRALAIAYEKVQGNGGQTVLRRLNRYELRNTLRDLLYLEGVDFQPGGGSSRLVDNNGNGSVSRTGTDPLRFFPEDEEEDGFFNLGNHLVTSDFLLQLLLNAVEETLGRATHLEPKPSTIPIEFEGHLVNGRRNGEHVIETVSRELNPGFEMLAQGYERYGRLSPTDLRGGVKASARYRITVDASAHNPQHPWGEILQVDNNDPFQLCLNMADTKNRGIEGPTSTPLALWSVPADGQVHTFVQEAWLDEFWTVWLGWENGSHDRAFRPEVIVEKFFPERYTPRPEKNENKEAHEQWPREMARILFENEYQGPHIRIHRLKLEPIIPTWPPQSHTALYGSGSIDPNEVETLLTTFARRAFRRPVTREEVAPYVNLVLSRLDSPETLTLSPIQDLTFETYEGSWGKLPDFTQLTPSRKGNLPRGLIDLEVSGLNEKFGIVFQGNLTVPRPGTYRFEMASDDGARIFVDGKKVIEHDGLHGAQLKKGETDLEEGKVPIRVEYFAYGAPNSFRAGWSGPDLDLADLSVAPIRPPKNQSAGEDGNLPREIRAMRDGYSAILCSPQFLYLREAEGSLDDFEIATRLSYFLWSSMPDQALFDLAEKGKLSDESIRREQVERMLRDPRAESFVHEFPSVWLRLDKLGKMPPSEQFYRNLMIEPLLRNQVTAYFRELLHTNGHIEEFIDSDYTYMNQVLAKWIYKREDIRGARLQKVRLNHPGRGGIFTQPGVMTATANGVDTSPVVRGTWVLENVLGTPPAPPPPDVEPLPTDTREAQTIRQQLALHRKHEACNSCHRKIDPMGFAFENFDFVGRWRTHYKGVRDPIDTSAVLATGREIKDITEFKQFLMERKPLVIRCLTEKLLTHATGRQMEAADRGEIDRIVEELAANENRLVDLIHLVVQSEIFTSK